MLHVLLYDCKTINIMVKSRMLKCLQYTNAIFLIILRLYGINFVYLQRERESNI